VLGFVVVVVAAAATTNQSWRLRFVIVIVLSGVVIMIGNMILMHNLSPLEATFQP